jgi:hypothetical protein
MIIRKNGKKNVRLKEVERKREIKEIKKEFMQDVSLLIFFYACI